MLRSLLSRCPGRIPLRDTRIVPLFIRYRPCIPSPSSSPPVPYPIPFVISRSLSRSSSIGLSTLTLETKNTANAVFTSQDEEYMRYVLQLASEAGQRDEVPIGAVVVGVGYDTTTKDRQHGIKKDTKDSTINSTVIPRTYRVLGTGTNATRSQKNVTAHAEILALQNAQANLQTARLDNVTLYVTVEPCIMCLGACLLHHVQRIVYAAPSPKFGYFTGHICATVEDNTATEDTTVKDRTVGSNAIPILSSFPTVPSVLTLTEDEMNDYQPRIWPSPSGSSSLPPSLPIFRKPSSSSSSSSTIYNHRIRIDPYSVFRNEAIELLQNFFQKKR